MSIIQDIIDGKHDADLDGIVSAARDRIRAKGSALKYTLKKGDTFRIVNRSEVKPVYLRGMEFIVESLNPKTVSGKPVDPIAAKTYRGGIRVPYDMIEA